MNLETKPIRGSEVFWEAALEIFEEKERFCCHAIAKARGIELHNYAEVDENKIFTLLFKPVDPYCTSSWMGNAEDIYGDAEGREHRVWAMLFMEQIWKDEHES